MKLLIYSDQLSSRLTYTVDLIFSQLLGIPYELTNNRAEFESAQAARLNYSNHEYSGTLQIVPNGLLFEEHIESRSTKTAKAWYGVPTILLEADTHFDPLGMTFYLVSRYEEYGHFTPDAHQRFPAEASCLVRHDLIFKPLVNLWALRLHDVLHDRFPGITSNPREFEFRSTIDIDQAWKYRYKGMLRSVGGITRDILNRDWSLVKQRISVQMGNAQDPFYNFDWQEELHQHYQIDATYFIHVGKRGEFDKSTSINHPQMKRLIKRLLGVAKVGIHPSYQSNFQPDLVAFEKEELARVADQTITVSRQHFLMHKMPETYRTVIDAGIKEEHTMGYTTHMGFRAGIAAPFHFFDLKLNQATDLVLVPFCAMDITPLHYEQKTPEEAIERIKDLLWEVQNVGGLFVSLWHNESLSEDGRWKGWRKVYEALIGMA